MGTAVSSPLLMAGGAAQAAGDIQQGYAQSAAAGYNATVAQQNATLATQNAQWTGAEGEQQYGLAGLKTQQQVGAIKTGQAANNVDVNSGSALQVQQSQAAMGKLNESNIRSNAARQAYGFETAASQYTGQAGLYNYEAGQDVTAGYTRASADVLNAAGKAALNSSGGGGLGTDVLNTVTEGSVAADGGLPSDMTTNSLENSNTNTFLGSTPSSNWLNYSLQGSL